MATSSKVCVLLKFSIGGCRVVVHCEVYEVSPHNRVFSTAWTLFDATRHIYESVATFSSMPDGPRGIFLAPDGIWYKFVEYGTRANLACDNELAIDGGCIYMGYGIIYDPAKQKL